MYTPEERQLIRRRYEFEVDSQYDAQHHATIRDVMDTVHVAMERLKELKGQKAAEYDDSLHVYAGDEGIIFYFEVEERP